MPYHNNMILALVDQVHTKSVCNMVEYIHYPIILLSGLDVLSWRLWQLFDAVERNYISGGKGALYRGHSILGISDVFRFSCLLSKQI